MLLEVEKGEFGVIDKKVYLDNKFKKPHCKKHGAMIKVTSENNDVFSIWRCIICHVGCLYDNNPNVPEYLLEKNKDKIKVFENKDLKEEFDKLLVLLNKEKIGFRVVGEFSKLIQGEDVNPNKIEIEVNERNYKKVLDLINKSKLSNVLVFKTKKKYERYCV